MDAGPTPSAWIERVVTGSMRNFRLVLGAWVIVCLLAAIGVSKLDIETNTRSFLDRGGREWAAYQKSLEVFGGDEFLVIAIEGAEPFDPAALRAVWDLSEQLEKIPGVRRIDSISTVPVVYATPDGDLSLEPAMLTKRLEREEIDRIAARVKIDRVISGSLVSKDGRVFAINLRLDGNIDANRAALVARVEEMLQGSRAWVSGVPVFRTKVNTRTESELQLFVPLTLLMIGIVVFAAYRQFGAVVISLGGSGFGTLATLGAMGALGTPLTLSTLILPSVLLALGCAYSMHLLSAARGIRDPIALEAALLGVAQPVALSGLTTVIGFLAMSIVSIDAIRQLGTYGALGTFMVLAATLSAVPALLRIAPLGDGDQRLAIYFRDVLATHLTEFVIRRKTGILIAWTLCVVGSSGGLLWLHVESDIILWFPKGVDVRDSYEEIRSRLAGITPMNVVIESKNGVSVTEPSVVATIDRFTRYLESLASVGKAISFVDPLAQLHNGFSGSGDGRLPQSRDAIEQYLLLLSSIPHMNEVISNDHETASVLLRVDENGSNRIAALARTANAWWDENGSKDFNVATTGIMYEFARAQDLIAYGQIQGLTFAFLAIGTILFAIFRRVSVALLTLIPNLIPLGIAYSLMGYAGIPLDAATICLGSLALGIGVDDTIHVATRYRDGIQGGFPPPEALRFAIPPVLSAVVLTTVAISIGFAVLIFSEFTLIRNLGAITVFTVTVCLLADLTLLPALLLGRDTSSSAESRPRKP